MRVLFVRAFTCKLVYIRRKLMCNFVQLLGKVCWYHTATWRVSNETDIKAAKKRSFVCCLHYLQHECLHCQHEKWLLGSLIIFWGITGYIVMSKTFTIWLKWGPWGAVCDKCKLQAGRQVSYKVKFVVKCPNRFPVPELDLKKTQSLGTGNWLEYFTLCLPGLPASLQSAFFAHHLRRDLTL